MLVGFIHGVMNTDNMAISGETIDYGPCAFMDAYDPATVFSSIDHGGRYAYGNQPHIAQWNLARLAETLLPLIDDETDTAVAAATEVLETFPARYGDHWRAGMRAKLGLGDPRPEHDELFIDLLELLKAQRVDYTSFFRALVVATPRPLFADPGAFDAWADGWQPVDTSAAGSGQPVYIPRNHLVEEALDAATAGDLEPFMRLVELSRTRSTSAPAWRTTPSRRRRASARTAPSAAPDGVAPR